MFERNVCTLDVDRLSVTAVDEEILPPSLSLSFSLSLIILLWFTLLLLLLPPLLPPFPSSSSPSSSFSSIPFTAVCARCEGGGVTNTDCSNSLSLSLSFSSLLCLPLPCFSSLCFSPSFSPPFGSWKCTLSGGVWFVLLPMGDGRFAGSSCEGVDVERCEGVEKTGSLLLLLLLFT